MRCTYRFSILLVVLPFSYFDDYHYTTDQYFWNMSCNSPVGHEIRFRGS